MFWHSFRRRRRSPGSLLRALALSVLMVGAFGGGVARAGDDAFCVDAFVGVGSACYGAPHTLTSVRGTNEGAGAGCGGAYNYGTYYCADPTGCHTYAAVYVLTPGIRHRSTTSGRYMRGEETYGSTPVGPNCDPGTPYEITGPLNAAASNAEGAPVFDRAKVTAPDDVAAVIPDADAATARAFTTPHGKAWLLTDAGQRQACIVADDNGTGYGVSCIDLGALRDSGSVSTFEDADGTTAAGDVVIALMPKGVDRLTIDRTDGTSRTVAAQGGVVATTLTGKDAGVTLAASPTADASVKGTKQSLVTRKPRHRRH
ncbi:MAG: hypothetical protein AAGC46_05210 [Solirubrobacteraceae bacterium]|nr:hypothetical protein [Patulibacter sp.]